ncbi:MAG TPA: c-type cytochrome biogenesis protein CcsB [Bacteroidales bacterium]|nr:c-type cytochrome biogenesis protein CcsB [Bacteroidales bacterium]
MRVLKLLFSPLLTASLFVIAVITMAAATFIGNDFGADAAYSTVYGARWFEILLLFIVINLSGQLVMYRMFRKQKLAIALFHIAFIIMIAGAGITRYFGWEGSVHIREGETTAKAFPEADHLGYRVYDAQGDTLTEYSVHFIPAAGTANKFKKKIEAGSKTFDLVLTRVIPNALQNITDDTGGVPMISLMATKDMQSGEQILLRDGETKEVYGLSVALNSDDSADIRIIYGSGVFSVVSDIETQITSMMTRESVTNKAGIPFEIKPMQVIMAGDIRLVAREMAGSGRIQAVHADPGHQLTGESAFIFSLGSGNESQTVTLWKNDQEDLAISRTTVNGYTFEIFFGSIAVNLPFSLHLEDFILERYPGSNSPSGYRSEVNLTDSKTGEKLSASIYMNNILKYRGYRLYQSSYDSDELGTILSVNHDPAGLAVTYTGYATLILFIILSLLSRNSFFRNVKPETWTNSLRKMTVVLFFLVAGGSFSLYAQPFVPGKEAADELGSILVQDQKGRTKPLHTLAGDIMRKVTRETGFNGLTPLQVFFAVHYDFEEWKDVAMIRVSDRDLRRRLGISDNKAAFSDLVEIGGDGSYRLSSEVNQAYEKPPGSRSRFDKEVIKVDERLNILYMVYRGDFMNIFPLKDGTTSWGPATDALEKAVSSEDSLYIVSVDRLLYEILENNNKQQATQLCESLNEYQQRFSEYDLPSDSKIRAERIYYRLGLFEKLFPFYVLTGILMLSVLVIMVINGAERKKVPARMFGWILLAGFVLHTAGLALRWYISGHSPMSNGYESMIFISWVTLFAGFIFRRRSDFALAGTAVLAGMTLLVAHMSFMDPEITNLVPVLQSYWLTLHVSVITSSYAFLGLGAILGLITMILLLFTADRNRSRISETLDNLVVINFRTLTLGLYLLTIGTFLGAIWANESWGRYWGWDPKETWSLITITVYAFVTHSRLIPGMKDIYTFNFLSLVAFASVLMTYFGVNYYLSGLHSYAGGEPVPVPLFVYLSVIFLAVLCVAAYLKYRQYSKR